MKQIRQRQFRLLECVRPDEVEVLKVVYLLNQLFRQLQLDPVLRHFRVFQSLETLLLVRVLWKLPCVLKQLVQTLYRQVVHLHQKLFRIQGVSDLLLLRLRYQRQCCMNPEQSLKMQTVQTLRIRVLLILGKYRFCVFWLCSFSYSPWPVHARWGSSFWLYWKRAFPFREFFGLVSFDSGFNGLGWDGVLASCASTKYSRFFILDLFFVFIVSDLNIDQIVWS